MAKLRIPEKNLPGLRRIGELSTDELNQLEELLETLPHGISSTKFFDALRSLKISNINDIGTSLYSLSSLLTENEYSYDALSEDIVISYADLEGISDDETLKKIKVNLRSLLDHLTSPKIAFELFDSVSRSHNLLRRTSITADAKIVFSENAKPTGTIAHILKIFYDTNEVDGKSKSFILDNSDLVLLKNQIEASLLKEQNIMKSNLDRINFIDLSSL